MLKKPLIFSLLIAGLGAAGASGAGIASDAPAADVPQLEAGLMASMRMKKDGTDRAGDSGAAIRAYKMAGLVNQKPDRRADYTDYYLLNQPASFMGHQLVVIEEEYMGRYIGCCVSPGVGITVRLAGASKALENFAEANKCSFVPQTDMRNTLRDISLKAHFIPGRYASLSCRERDATP